ncbi:ferrous iron transporter B [Patescibacteria group bacterium]|nr:ferrous iron transporter B [Patescibacteria group bacterium]
MLNVDERWDLIDRIARKTVKFEGHKPALKDVLGDLTVKPLTGIPFAIAVIYGGWGFFVEFAGTLLTDGFFCKIFDEHWLVWLRSVFPGGLGNWFYSLMIDAGHMENGVLVASDNCFEAFGVITSGLFIAFGVVLWAVLAFYLIFALLEDVGYLPRLAVLIDTLLHKIGLHGYAIVPTFLGLGCNIPGILATRILETKKQRFSMMSLLVVFVPCGAQIGIMQNLIPNMIGWVFLSVAIGYFGFGYVLSKLVPGESPEILADVPPYQMPTLRNIRMKLWLRTSHFLCIAVPFVILGSLIVGILYLTGAMDKLAWIMGPFLTRWWKVPSATVAPLVAGFLRKDLAVGMLGGIEMSSYQLFKSVVLLSIYFPCLATFVMLLKEEKWKELLGTLGFLALVIATYGGALHLIGILLGGYK